MFVHFGQDHYGKVDYVPGLCYVVTRFIHANFIPIWPVESTIIVVGTEKRGHLQGVKTALSVKSILIAWVRTVLFVAFIGCAVASIWLTVEFFQPAFRKPDAGPVEGLWGVTVVTGVGLWLTYRLTRAGYARALQLGAELGLEAAFVERYLTTAKEDRGDPAMPEKEPEGWERYS